MTSFKINLYKIITSHTIEEIDSMFLIGVLLHYNKEITNEQFMPIVKKHRTGKLPFKRTYHCHLNDKWYDRETYLTILLDVLDDKRVTSHTIEFEDLLKYINLSTNKVKNWNIDWVKEHLIDPFLNVSYSDLYQIERRFDTLMEMFNIKKSSRWPTEQSNEFHLNFISYDSFHVSGYCCEDCDGSFHSYKHSQWMHEVVHEVTKEFMKFIDIKLNKFRKLRTC